MRVSLLYFGVLRELVGAGEGSLEVAGGATVADLMQVVRTDSAVWGTVAVAVNREYAGLGTVLAEGDEVAFLPPVSGGLEILSLHRGRRRQHPALVGVESIYE